MKTTKTIFKGKLLELILKKRRLPNGYVATLEMIKHPGASLIVPLLTRNKVIMLRQWRPVINSYIYELPAGTRDEKESPLSCARREIEEETGFSAKKLTPLGRIYPVPGYSTEIIFLYKAQGLRPKKAMAEEDEVIKTRAFTKDEVKRLFKKGKIVDAKTISAFAFCGWI